MKTDGTGSCRHQRRTQINIELAGHRHLDDFECGGIGDAPAGDDVWFLAKLALQIAYLWTAAVNHDDVVMRSDDGGYVGAQGGKGRPPENFTTEFDRR